MTGWLERAITRGNIARHPARVTCHRVAQGVCLWYLPFVTSRNPYTDVCDTKIPKSDCLVADVAAGRRNLLPVGARAPRIARVMPLKYIRAYARDVHTHPLNQCRTCKSAISHSRIIGIQRAAGYCGGNTEARKRVGVIPHFDTPRSPPNKRHATIPIDPPLLLRLHPVRDIRDTRSSVSFIWQDSNDSRSIIRQSGRSCVFLAAVIPRVERGRSDIAACLLIRFFPLPPLFFLMVQRIRRCYVLISCSSFKRIERMTRDVKPRGSLLFLALVRVSLSLFDSCAFTHLLVNIAFAPVPIRSSSCTSTFRDKVRRTARRMFP